MWERVKTRAELAYQILREAGQRYGRNRVTRMAAAISYRMIFALAPLMLIAVWVFGLVVGDDTAARAEIFDTIAAFAGDQLAQAVETFVASAVTGGDVAAVVGFALLLWTASSLFLEVQNNLNDIFEVPYEHTTGVLLFMTKRGLGFVWTLGLGLLVLLIWALNLVWGLFGTFFEDQGWGMIHRVVGLLAPVISLVLLPVLFALVFQSMTRVRVPRKALFVGSAFTAVAFTLAAVGVGLYFEFDEETSASQIAGALFVILLATFLLSSVFLFGAQVTKVYSQYLQTGDVGRIDDGVPEVVVSEPEPSVPFSALIAFLGGLFVGRRSKK